jgi:hypothetical protein
MIFDSMIFNSTILNSTIHSITSERSRFASIAVLLFAALLLVRCGGSGSSHQNAIAAPSSNVQSISVNSGIEGNYANGIFTSVTVCMPSSSNCQTIGDVLVDTGSYGLRLLSSAGGGALTLTLPQQTGTNGNTVGECAVFLSGLTWGPVATADIQIAGESASSVPVQVIDPTFAALPATCQDFGVPEQDTLQTVGANGILGVGAFIEDCGPACTATGSGNPGLYYSCTGTSCQVAAQALAQQVQNPVGSFATDNNGVIVELPSVSAPTASISGSLVFGIGTQSNNGVGSASVFPLDGYGNFTTSYNGQSYPAFVDSGSNGFFFLDSALTSLPLCPDTSSFYCPTSSANLSATDSSGSTSEPISFTVDNADTLFSNSANGVFPSLAGPNPGTFDWGLPFFFGRNVFTAIDTRSTPAGEGPYSAF